MPQTSLPGTTLDFDQSQKPSYPVPVETVLEYYQPNADGSPPAANDLEIQYGQKSLNRHPVKVQDMRQKQFTLEKNGFTLIPFQSEMVAREDFADKAKVKAEYYPEVAEQIKSVTKAKQVLILNHNVRSAAKPKMNWDLQKIEHVGPMRRVHVDVAPAGIEEAVIKRVGADYMDTIKGRWKLINAWKPITTVMRDPLCIADAESTPDDDLINVQRFRPDGTLSEERYMVKAGVKDHEWYFAPNQRPDELLLFNQYSDFADRGIADRVAHAAFVVPGTDDQPTRESVEVRALVVY